MLRKLLDSAWTYFALAGLLLVGALVASMVEIRFLPRPVGSVEDIPKLAERKPLNVVFLLIDTLRADRLSAYGYERETSPVMDFLANTGIRFAHVESQSSWTKASMASLWAASYPRRIGVTRYPHALAEDTLLPAEIFRAAGYKTGGIVRNGWVEPNFGFGQGFDVYFRAKLPSATPRKLERHNPSAHPLTGSDWDATESAIEFIRGHHHQPFLLYVHYMDVHQYTYDTDSGIFGTDIRDIYDNAIHWTDRNVSALLATLEEHDLMEETVVVIASDHGEAFYEHGHEGHARDLYRQVTEVPLIVALPFRLEPGIVVQERVQNVDIWPTVLDLVGLDPMPRGDGRSLVPLILAAGRGVEPPADLATRPAFAELDRSWGRKETASDRLVAVVDGDYRMIRSLDTEDGDGVELYDRRSDPLEQRDIANRQPEKVKELAARVQRYVEAEALAEAPRVELDEMRIMQLRALGYVDVGK